ncbi:MAG: hypothetical protein J6386_18045 [Candidatus Synoicihabitans palmerolidicus]|nr:hypothetical protein [Candidatus Synoicihabitans palmerolidicus]
MIEQLEHEFPHDPNIYRTNIQWLLDLDKTAQARRTSLMRRLRYPDQAQPRIDLLY